jgi:hypothetical protein
MRYMCGAEEDVSGANCGHPILYPVTAGAGGHEIEFVALMGNLRAVRRSSGEPYFQISVNESLSRSPRRPREGKCGGKRHWQWRMIHLGFFWRRPERLPITSQLLLVLIALTHFPEPATGIRAR